MDFELVQTDECTHARAGVITTDHGKIQTPIFMPVGTVASVKAVHQRELRDDIKAQIILGNTYHLYLRPGLDILRQAGGLHRFNGWERPILTDSGGFQVFSLSDRRKLTEEGAHFRSHIDGSKHLFTPENVVDTQRIIGADIMMALDECTPGDADYDYAKKSLALTRRWLDRGWKHFCETEGLYGYKQTFFPIVQGCVYPDLRIEAAKHVADLGADGNAIGGLAVGLLAFGGAAVGLFAMGGGAFGMYAAGGGAIASEIAIGSSAHAPLAIGQTAEGALTFGLNADPAAVAAAIREAAHGAPKFIQNILIFLAQNW